LIVYVGLFTTALFGQDSLTVKIERVTTNGISAKGKTAGFPYAVFSVISVADNLGQYVTGLADTAAWLGPADTAPKGVIRNLWPSAKEYFAGDSTLPANSDLYAQHIETQFLEMAQNTDIPTSFMLVMDQSRSLKQFELDTAKQAHKNFVNAMGPADRVGIVRFAENSDAIGITSDKDTLLSYIDSTTRLPGTRIFRAVARGLDSLKLETAQRRIMILFTDGQNDDPTGPDLDSLITEFNKENITVYTVGLDVGVQGKKDLQKLASRTGGFFYDTNDAPDVIIFYDRLIELTHKFYLMAHYSPAPCGDEAGGGDSTRTVAVKVTDLVHSGGARGNYNPPATPKTYDLAVLKSADRDTLNLSENLGYQIDIINSGPDTAFDVFVVDTISSYLTASGYSLAPDSVSGNKHYWHFDSLASGNAISINYTAALNATPPDTLTALQSGVGVFTACDNNAGNDASGVSVTLNRNTVLQMTTTVQTDSFTVDNGDTTWYAFPGDSICFTINVSNTGGNVAQNVVLRNILPDSVSFAPFGGGDTLTFNLGNLAIGADTTLSICPVFVSDSLPFYPFTLDNETILNADNIPGPVTERDTVTVLAPPPTTTTLDVTRKVVTDSFTVDNGDTTWYAATGETYAIRITVKNSGSITATNVLLRDVLPDSVINAGDTLSFAIGNLPAGSDTTVTVNPTVVSELPFAPFPLVNTILASADNAVPSQQSFVDTVLAYIGPTDLILTTTVQTDSFTVDNGDTTWYAFPGGVAFKAAV
jgi:uncharacterized repeat protein (TIGR01451 family)